MPKSIFQLSLFILLVIGCTRENDIIDCTDTICTLELRNYSLSITDTANDKVALDTFQVIDITNNKDITATFTDAQLLQYQETGSYPLYGDRFANMHRNQTLKIVFKGFIKAVEVVNVPFKVGADCCHAHIISGDLAVTINRP